MKNYSPSLLVDIGNTRVKWKFIDAQFGSEKFSKQFSSEHFNVLDRCVFDVNKLPKAPKVFVACVAHNSILDAILSRYPRTYVASSEKHYKHLSNAYESAHTLGIDRWLGLIACYELYPKTNILLISVGTATTLDVLAESGAHQGGLIMPGLKLLENSAQNLNILRHNSPPTERKIFSDIVFCAKNNTQDAWYCGCYLMFVSALKDAISHLCKYSDTKIILTGGYALPLSKHLDFSYKVHHNLVLTGLYFFSQQYMHV